MTIKKAQDLKPGDTLERWNGPAVVESVTDASLMSDALAVDSDVEVQ